MPTSFNNDGNYSINVMAISRNLPDDQSLSTPLVSIVWNVIRSYKSENPDDKIPISDEISSHPYHDEFTSFASTNYDYRSPQWRDIISGMISRINFHFELDRLIWKHRFNTIKQLTGVDDMISQILEVINGMVVSGRKKAGLLVTVDKQYTLTHEEYEAKVRARKERELTDHFMNLTATLRREMDRVQDHQEARRVRRAYDEQLRRIEDEMRANNISLERTMGNAMLLELEAIRESFDQAVTRPRPASRASVEALEKFVLGDGDACLSSICVICMEEMSTGCQVTRMPCSSSHVFHGGCIIEWLNRWGHTCPLCKFKLPKERRNVRQKS